MGLILVFDMDQTILDSSDPYLFNNPVTPQDMILLKQKIKESLNWNVVNIIKRAAALRPSRKVTAIYMLTNNSSRILVSAVDEVLLEEIGSKGKYKTLRSDRDSEQMPDKPYFFDYIMMRQHYTRPKTADDNPPKSINDILNMMQYMGLDGNIDSAKDIYFFDDIATHNLKAEFNFLSDGKYSNHYIHINPPYSKYVRDRTQYDSILSALSELDGNPPKLPLLNSSRNSRPNTPVTPPSFSLNQNVIHRPNVKRPTILGAFKGGKRLRKTRNKNRLSRSFRNKSTRRK